MSSNSTNSTGSSSDTNARSTTLVFDECHTRVQTVSELLLISCTPRPVFTAPSDLALTNDNFEGFRDRVIGQLNKMLLLSREVATQVHSKQIHWRQVSHRVKELTTITVCLLELSAHISYLMAVRDGEGHGGVIASPGPVESTHRLMQADLDIRFSCQRLKRSQMNDLQPHLLVDLCTALTKSLSVMTEVCRQAAEKVQDSYDQDQFKLCVKAITSTISCLVTSIKSFKRSPSDALLRRVVSFCDPVIAASAALLAFTTEDGFTGSPARLTEHSSEMYKASLGLSVSISSATIQMFRAVRDLVHASSSSKRHQDRLSLCVESLTRSSGQLRDMLLSHSFVPNPAHSPLHSGHSNVSPMASLTFSEKGGISSSFASTTAASWVKEDVRPASTHGEPGKLELLASESKQQQQQNRLSLSPRESPRLSAREGHGKHSHHSHAHAHSSPSAGSKTSKSTKKDKDGSRSPRTKEKRHKSSSSSSTTTSSSSHHSHPDKDRSSDAHPPRGDRKRHASQDSNQSAGADNSRAAENRQAESPSSLEKEYDGTADFFFSQPSPLSPSSSSSVTPGSRPTSMDVEVVLASLDPDSPSPHSLGSEGDIGSETLPALRELHIEGGGLDGAVVEGSDEESCNL